MDPFTHKRYLDYRDRFGYFGRQLTMMSLNEFATVDAEYRTLFRKGEDARDATDDARLAELARVLLRD